VTSPTLECLDDERRKRVRTQGAGGIDYVEVSHDQRTLAIYFIGPVPDGLSRENIRIDGGRHVRDLRPIELSIGAAGDEEQDGWAEVRVDRPGDYSTYTIRLVALDASGQPTDQPMAGLDARYASLDFSFKAGCPQDIDCEVEATCPPWVLPEPDIDYLAKDYASFRRLMLDRLALTMPDWTERHVPDIGITLVELLAYVGDYLSYFQDAVANEAYLQTARQRISVRRHVRLIDYRMHEGCNARAWLCLRPAQDFQIADAGQIFFTTDFPDAPAEGVVMTALQLARVPDGSYEVFEPLAPGPGQPIDLYAAHTSIAFYTWGNRSCCLPEGATAATLKDGDPYADGAAAPDAGRSLKLQAGDVLIFEEVKGPRTGLEPDADPKHRQAVRLTRVTPGVDALYRQPVLNIEWGVDDRLRFPLCISAIGEPPACANLEDISVACGNIILVDQGRHHDVETLGPVPPAVIEQTCEDEGEVGDPVVRPVRFFAVLQGVPLAFAEAPPGSGPAWNLLASDPTRSLPEVSLMGTEPDGTVTLWKPRLDLLSSSPDEASFVVEIDNDGFAHLRFGDGELGRAPSAGTTFQAAYRVGNGRRGNVGADSIRHLVFRSVAVFGTPISVSNPLPASGGLDPEPMADVKKLAPRSSFARQRAITADDYADLAQRNPKLQRAAATLSWTGSWYEADVELDPLATETAGRQLVDQVADDLEQFRRIGHDLTVALAHYVPLDLAMELCLEPQALRAHVRAALRQLFSDRTLPGGAPAFFHPDNLTFGQPIYVSRLIAAAQAMPGVESVIVTRLERLREGPNGELVRGLLPIGPMEIAQLDNDPGFPERGRLSLELRGGR
jgi:hypothetical protein